MFRITFRASTAPLPTVEKSTEVADSTGLDSANIRHHCFVLNQFDIINKKYVVRNEGFCPVATVLRITCPLNWIPMCFFQYIVELITINHIHSVQLCQQISAPDRLILQSKWTWKLQTTQVYRMSRIHLSHRKHFWDRARYLSAWRDIPPTCVSN